MGKKLVSAILLVLGLWFLFVSDANSNVLWGIVLLVAGVVVWAAGGGMKAEHPSSTSSSTDTEE